MYIVHLKTVRASTYGTYTRYVILQVVVIDTLSVALLASQLTGFESQLPAVEVHGRQLPVVGLGDVDVERLALVDEGAPVCRHLKHALLRDFPHGLVESLHIVGNAFNGLEESPRVMGDVHTTASAS